MAAEAGVDDLGMGWGTLWLDCDNDGLQDIYVSNDSYFSPYPNLLYRNLGNQTFQVVSHGSPLASMYGGYGAASADFNDDGMADIFLANSGNNDNNQLFLNLTDNNNNWVKIKLTGTQSNRAAIGARVEIEAGGKKMIDEVTAGASYASQNSFVLHFGLGDAEAIDRMVVRWPNGLVEEYGQLAANATYQFTEGETLTSTFFASDETRAELQAWPTLIHERLTLSVNLEQAGRFQLTVKDINGRLVAQLAEGHYPAGMHVWEWMPGEVPAGVYFCHLKTPAGQQVVKVVLPLRKN